jgi:hypothetical protein
MDSLNSFFDELPPEQFSEQVKYFIEIGILAIDGMDAENKPVYVSTERWQNIEDGKDELSRAELAKIASYYRDVDLAYLNETVNDLIAKGILEVDYVDEEGEHYKPTEFGKVVLKKEGIEF